MLVSGTRAGFFYGLIFDLAHFDYILCSPLLPVAYLSEALNCLVVSSLSLSVIYALVFRALRPSDDICSHFSMCYLFRESAFIYICYGNQRLYIYVTGFTISD